MKRVKAERRRWERILFSEQDGITGTFRRLSQPEQGITAPLSDLCEDGLCFILRPGTEGGQLHEADHLLLTAIAGTENLQGLVNMEVEIKWILNLEQAAVGCEFLNASQTMRDHIRKFICARG